jgi:hypothetical protein
LALKCLLSLQYARASNEVDQAGSGRNAYVMAKQRLPQGPAAGRLLVDVRGPEVDHGEEARSGQHELAQRLFAESFREPPAEITAEDRADDHQDAVVPQDQPLERDRSRRAHSPAMTCGCSRQRSDRLR